MLLGKNVPDLLNDKFLELALLHVALAYGTFRPREFFPVGRWRGDGHKDRTKMIFEGQ